MRSLKKSVKEFLLRASPSLLGGVFASRSRRVAQRTERREGLPLLSQKLVDEYGRSVKAGPFKRMILPEAMVGRHIGPFLLGSYESGLHSAIGLMKEQEYDTIIDIGSSFIDIGSSFGYYAVGFARLFPAATVFAYDTDPWARREVKRMAVANGVQNVRVRSACTPTVLERRLAGRSLIFSDCEGYEHELFGNASLSALEKSDFLIEVHPGGDEKAMEDLKSMFEESHELQVLSAEGGEAKQAFLPSGAPPRAVKEWRSSNQQWLYGLANGESESAT